MFSIEYRLCQQHSARARRRYEAVDRANPGATPEFWEHWYEKETLRQVEDQLRHCGAGEDNG